MNWNSPAVARTELAAAGLQAAITIALALLCLFLYRRHGKPYFAWFAAAWGLYVLRLAAIGSFLLTGRWSFLYAHQVVTGLTALALLWAALVFSRQPAWRWRYLLVALFPVVWSLVAIYRLDSFLLAAAPMVAFLAGATAWSGWTFWSYHRKVGRTAGARLLAVAFALWGVHHLDYPLLRARGAWTPWGYYLDIAFELAVGLGIVLLVLDDLRRGLGALSALSGDLQRSPRERDVLDALLARPLQLPAVRGTAFYATLVGDDGGTPRCVRGAGACAAWEGTRATGPLADALASVQATGRPQAAPGADGHAYVAALPVLTGGTATGALVLAGDARDPFTALDEDFLRALGQQVGAALHSAALYRALEARTAELERLSLRMVRQHEEERRRLSRELHDETAQVFSAVKMQLGMLREGAGVDGPQRQRFDRVLALIDTGIGSIRSVTADLRPSLLDDLGLVAALRSLCAEFAERTGITASVALPERPLPPLPEDADLALFRALQEGLSNVARHARATTVTVRVAGDALGVRVTLTDDGGGLPASADPARWEREGHMGLVGMRERIGALGGTVSLENVEGGAVLRVWVPAVVPDEPAPEPAVAAALPR